MMKIERKDVLIIICLLLIGFLIRVDGGSNISMYGDEWGYWIKTNKILANDFVPRADVFLYSPPFLSYIGAVVTLFLGGDLNVLRMISVIIGSLTIPFLYLLGKEMYDRNVGLLAAFFMTFSAYHSLYSRIYMLEALTLFFSTVFLYFFWLSESEKKIKYACLAGVFLGLSLDAKFISFFFIPSIFLYLLWMKGKDSTALINRRIILMFLFAFITFLPVLISLFYTGAGLQPISFHIIDKFKTKAAVGHSSALDFSPVEFITRGGNNILQVVLTWGAETLNFQWMYFFKISAILLFLITILYCLYKTARREKRESFLLIPLFSLGILILGVGRIQHYLIYIQPHFYLLLSYLFVKVLNDLKRDRGYKNIFRIFTVILMAIIFISVFVTGITSSSWEEGDYDPWIKRAVNYVRIDAQKNNYNEQIVVGVIAYNEHFVEYPFSFSDLDVYTINLLEPGSKYGGDLAKIDLDKIRMLKPMYIIASEQFYRNYFIGAIKTDIFIDYRIVFHAKGYPYVGFVFKKKNAQNYELRVPESIKTGEISMDSLDRSLPNVMNIGDPYIASVKVKNIGNQRTNFTIRTHSDLFTIFVDKSWQSATLDAGSSYIFKFTIVPFKKVTGKVPIIVDLYARDEDSKMYLKADSVSKNITLN